MKRRTFVLGSLATVAGASAGGLTLSACGGGDSASKQGVRRYGDVELTQAASSDGPNVLFVSIDDLNDWLGFLNNHPGTRTPNLDALAALSLVFSQAYCTAPVCLPSRSAIMFGQPPHRSGVYDHSDESRARYDTLKQATPSLVDDLWAGGYDVFGAGKIFHGTEKARWTDYRQTLFYVPAISRDAETTRPEQYDPDWRSPYDGKPIGRGEAFKEGMVDFGPSGVDAVDEPDGQAVEWVRARLAGKHDRPFFLGLGFVLPHEPWRLPKRFFDLHPLDEVVVPEFRPEDLDDLSGYARDNLIDTHHIFETLRKSGLLEEAVQAYQAAISFVDDQVGRLLDDLASSPLADETITVVWSDNAHHLGEKLHFTKFTLWERATHVPLLIHAPGRFDSKQTFDRPVSTIDLGPTVADLCGVEVHAADHDGRSLLPLLANPEGADERPPITTWLPGNHAVRRGPWRYIRYETGDRELYDHRADPQEFTNLAGRSSHAKIVSELDAFLPKPGEGPGLSGGSVGAGE